MGHSSTAIDEGTANNGTFLEAIDEGTVNNGTFFYSYRRRNSQQWNIPLQP